MDYQIAIPSYQRPEWLATRTLTTLLNGGVSPDRITVFVHDHDPHIDAYRDVTAALGTRLHITPARGIREQRRHIMDHYPEGTPIVSMDDDIEAVLQAHDRKTLAPLPDLHNFFTTMFQELRQRDLYVWGISPVPNAYFMRPGQLAEGLKLVMFTLYGYINRPDHPVQHTTVEYKDEQELSLRAYWWDGAILRADGVAVKANYYGEGGCTAAGRIPAQVRDSQDLLLAQWPGHATENTNKKTGWPEMRLTPKKRHPGHSPDTPPPGLQPPA